MPTKPITHVHQASFFACGAACLAMVCAYHGVAVDQNKVYQQLSEPDPLKPQQRRRISVVSLINYARGLGFGSTWWGRCPVDTMGGMRAALKEAIDKHGPLILCVQFRSNPQAGHFIVVSGYDNMRVTLHDPMDNGPTQRPWNMLWRMWQPSGTNVTGGVYIMIKRSTPGPV